MSISLSFMKQLPQEVLQIISGYYGQRINKDLSNQIRGQQTLNKIKHSEYYNKEQKIWRLHFIIYRFLDVPFADPKMKNKHCNLPWKDWDDKLINRIWWSYNEEERNHVLEKHFSHVDFDKEEEALFITGRQFIRYVYCIYRH